jgi:hypothetical protein
VTALGLVFLHACILLGGIAGKAAVVICAVAVLIGAPIAVLAWLGSLADTDAQRKRERRRLAVERYQAQLWCDTLMELQPAAYAEIAPLIRSQPPRVSSPSPVVWGSRLLQRPVAGARRRILALVFTIGSVIGLMGCDTTGPDWAAVQPGMAKTDLVALVGAPQQIKTNGSIELWQYCRDFLGRNARYYMTVLLDQEQVRDVRPYPVWSNAGCEDFFRAAF